MRLAKFLAAAGVASRRKAEELIVSGEISVNGQIIKSVSTNIIEAEDKITFKNIQIKLPDLKYFLLNKPAGYTTSTKDIHADKLITELMDDKTLLPAGRLDRDTSGLIIMTNDGDLIYKITHPKFEHLKEYVATTRIPLTKNEIYSLRSGIRLEDGPIKPDDFSEISTKKYKIVIHEGRNRIVRRIFEYFSKPVTSLERISVAGIYDENLKSGCFRKLTQTEIMELKKRD